MHSSDSALLYIPHTRLIWMDCPTAERVETLAAELEWHHEAHYMVWNVAGTGDAGYEPEAFGGRVVQLRYPGHLCPPVLTLVEACASIHAWLRADAANFVAVHCRSGRGRSAVLLACVAAFLAVHGEAHDSSPTSPIDWLSYLAHLRGVDETALTLPTHRRYLQYFAELLHSGVPAGGENSGCELRGVTLHSFPRLSTPPCVHITSGTSNLYLCTTAAEAELPDADVGTQSARRRVAYSYQTARMLADGRSAFPVIYADAVLTIRESDRSGPLLCRAGFHVDFAAEQGVLRMPCNALDGAFTRLPSDCFVDLILAPRPPEPGTKGSGGTLGSAVESLRRAGASRRQADPARCRDTASAFGGSRQPAAVFAFADDDDDPSTASPSLALHAAGGAVAAKVPPPSTLPPQPPSEQQPEASATMSSARKPALSPLELLNKYSAPPANGETSAAAAAPSPPVAIEEPITAEPPAAEPAVTEPTAAQLLVADIAAAETARTDPPAEETVAAEPVAAEPAAAEPAVDEPPTADPPTAKPTAAEPVAAELSSAEPPAAEPPPPKEPLAEGETVKAVTDDFEARSAALDAQIAEELGAELSLAELGEDMDGRELADVDAEFEALLG